MPNFNFNSRLSGDSFPQEPAYKKVACEKDLMMEEILNNLNTTPIGQVLKKIASLPEVNKDKILSVRSQLTNGKYDLNGRLDIALDKVLEDLTT